MITCKRSLVVAVEAVEAWGHDMCAKTKLVPGGILEPVTGRSFVFFGTSYKTSDFIVDGLLLWWDITISTKTVNM